MKRGTAGIIWLGVVGAVIAAFAGATAYIEHRAISEAADHGITLSIGSTHWLSDGIHFESVTATTVQIPNARISIRDLAMDWDGGFSEIVANGGEVTIDGPVTPPNPVTRDNPVPVTHGPRSIHVQSAHILWTHALGDASVDFANVTGDIPFAATPRPTVTWTTDISVSVAGRSIGPFSAELTQGNGEESLQLFADPADHASENLTVRNVDIPGARTYELTINDRPLSKIGIPLDLFGINIAGDPKIRLHITDHIERPPSASASSGNGSFDLVTEPIAIPGLPTPAPITIDVAWSGNPDQAVPVHDSSFQIDPFHGPITGTISRPENAIVLDLALTSQPVPCAKFSTGDPLKSLLGGSPLGALAAFTGTKSSVSGDVKLSASVQFDSRNPGARHISLTPESTCGLSISLGSGQN